MPRRSTVVLISVLAVNLLADLMLLDSASAAIISPFYSETYASSADGVVQGSVTISVANGVANIGLSENDISGGYDWRIFAVLFNKSSQLDQSQFQISLTGTPLSFTAGGGTDQYNFGIWLDVPTGTPIPGSSVDLLPTALNIQIAGLPSSASPSDFFISNSLIQSFSALTAEFEIILLANDGGTAVGGRDIASSTLAPAPPPPPTHIGEPSSIEIALSGLAGCWVISQCRKANRS